jgi:Mg2+ and Co2+ transporter CorA
MNEPVVNDWAFAQVLDQFKKAEVDFLEDKVDEAFKIISDLNYKWRDDEQMKLGHKKHDMMAQRLYFLKKVYNEGMTLVKQHESLVSLLSKWYMIWYENVSDEGRQGSEMMESQADLLNEIFVEIYKVLKPLNLDIKQPHPLNL